MALSVNDTYYVVLKKRMPERCFRTLFQSVVSELCLGLLNVVLTLFLFKLEVSNVVLTLFLNVVFERCFKVACVFCGQAA